MNKNVNLDFIIYSVLLSQGKKLDRSKVLAKIKEELKNEEVKHGKDWMELFNIKSEEELNERVDSYIDGLLNKKDKTDKKEILDWM